MIKKFKQNKDVWIKFGQFYFKDGKPDMARKLMQRSFKSLDKRDRKFPLHSVTTCTQGTLCTHCYIWLDLEILSKFGQMEFKEGQSERGKTMFENLLSTYPRRTDIWLVYIDQLTKLGDIPAVR